MSLILAIEPDKRQAAKISTLARGPLQAELIVTETASQAIALLNDRVPDVILTSMLLSPKDEAALADRLRELDAAGTRVQTLVIPVMATPRRRGAKKAAGGILTRLRGNRGEPATIDGCDPAVFADQILEYLERAAADRRAAAAALEDDLPPMSAPARPARRGAPGPESSPEIVSDFEKAASAFFRSGPQPPVGLQPEHNAYVPAPMAPPPAFEVIDVVVPATTIVADPLMTPPRGLVPFFQPTHVVPRAPVVERAAVVAPPPVVEPTPAPVFAPVATFEAAPAFSAPPVFETAPVHEAVVPVAPVVPVVPHRPNPVVFAPEPVQSKPAPGAVAAKSGKTVETTTPAPRKPKARTPAFGAWEPAPEPIELVAEPIDLATFVRELEAAAKPAPRKGAASPRPAPVVTEKTPEPEPEPVPQVVLTASTDVEVAAVISPVAAVAAVSSPAAAVAPAVDPELAEFEAALEALHTVQAPAKPVDDQVAAPVAESGAEPVAAVSSVTPGAASVAPPPAAAAPLAVVVETVVPPAPLVGDRDRRPTPVRDEPAASRKPTINNLLSSIRRDIEQLKSEKQPAANGAKKAAPVATAAAPAAIAAPVPVSVPAEEKVGAAAVGAEKARKRGHRDAGPVQDEWGIFDPEQAGFAALLSRLEEITEKEEHPVKRRR